MQDFESSFSDFLDRHEYDQAENALFSMVRISFKAGWMAAGGNPPKPQKVVQLFRPKSAHPANDSGDCTENLIKHD